jgi:hypothetical protein
MKGLAQQFGPIDAEPLRPDLGLGRFMLVHSKTQHRHTRTASCMTFRPKRLRDLDRDLLAGGRRGLTGYRVEVRTEVHRSSGRGLGAGGPFSTDHDDIVKLEHSLAISGLAERTMQLGLGRDTVSES